MLTIEALPRTSGLRFPDRQHRPLLPVDRIGGRLHDLGDRLHGLRAVPRVGAFVIRTLGGIGPDHNEIFVGFDQTMAGACRKNGNVPSLQRHDASLDAAKLDAGFSTGDAEDFIGLRMIVDEVINAPAPGLSPAVMSKQRIDHGVRITATCQIYGFAINHQWPSWIVRDDAIVGKQFGNWLPRHNGPLKPPRRRPMFGGLGEKVFNLILQYHSRLDFPLTIFIVSRAIPSASRSRRSRLLPDRPV